MRISDWSSDVCSSDLRRRPRRAKTADTSGPGKHARESLQEGDRFRIGPARAVAGLRERAPGRIVRLVRVRLAAVRRRARSQHRADAAGANPGGRRLSGRAGRPPRSEEHTSELQSLMRTSYDVFCLNKKKTQSETRRATF